MELAARLREDAEVAGRVAEQLDGGERRRWLCEQETYVQAAAIVGAAAEFRDGVSRLRTVLQLNVTVKNSLPRETWLRVGALVDLRCPPGR
jgi:hypothetical protein